MDIGFAFWLDFPYSIDIIDWPAIGRGINCANPNTSNVHTLLPASNRFHLIRLISYGFRAHVLRLLGFPGLKSQSLPVSTSRDRSFFVQAVELGSHRIPSSFSCLDAASLCCPLPRSFSWGHAPIPSSLTISKLWGWWPEDPPIHRPKHLDFGSANASCGDHQPQCGPHGRNSHTDLILLAFDPPSPFLSSSFPFDPFPGSQPKKVRTEIKTRFHLVACSPLGVPLQHLLRRISAASAGAGHSPRMSHPCT